jgi:hypothetical protein
MRCLIAAFSFLLQTFTEVAEVRINENSEALGCGLLSSLACGRGEAGRGERRLLVGVRGRELDQLFMRAGGFPDRSAWAMWPELHLTKA